MAHLSEDPMMIEAFESGLDIHTATAAKIYKVPLEEVNSDMRRKAKTANFGIIYGISTFGLAERLTIPRGEAKELIDGYFETYPGIKTYMDKAILQAKEKMIIHQVNCQGVMGSGIAKQIRDKYPEVYREYKNFCGYYSTEKLLGQVLIVPCHDGKCVANLFGQLNFGRDKCYTDYKALDESLTLLFKIISLYKEYDNIDIAIPYKIGCGTGGGDWSIVSRMIEQTHLAYENNIKHITIYKIGD
jgi:O-acetyl-ADP-ribose deacetylase (regulator of RNase III)